MSKDKGIDLSSPNSSTDRLKEKWANFIHELAQGERNNQAIQKLRNTKIENYSRLPAAKKLKRDGRGATR